MAIFIDFVVFPQMLSWWPPGQHFCSEGSLRLFVLESQAPKSICHWWFWLCFEKTIKIWLGFSLLFDVAFSPWNLSHEQKNERAVVGAVSANKTVFFSIFDVPGSSRKWSSRSANEVGGGPGAIGARLRDCSYRKGGVAGGVVAQTWVILGWKGIQFVE